MSKTKAVPIYSSLTNNLPEDGICSLCCYEHTCGLVTTEACCASEREDGLDVYFIEVE